MDRWCLVVFLVTTTCHSAFTLALDPCDQDCILGRLADLEMKQGASEAENHELREIISQQQSTIEVQARRIDALESTVKALQQAEPTPQEEEEPTQPVAHQHSDSSEHVTNDISDTKAAVAEDTTRTLPRRSIGHSNKDNVMISQTKRQERAGIAFSTYLDHDVEVSNHQTIKFNQIMTNEGNGYSIHTGVFTCPEAGMYLLTYFIGERDNRQQWVRMMVNSVNMVDAAIDTWHVNQDLQGGNTVIKRLKAGDAVWLESASDGGHIEGATGSTKFSTFSGVFLYA